MHARLYTIAVLTLAGWVGQAGFATPVRAVTIEWVAVGDTANAADTSTYGSVMAPYRIAETEVTVAQYTEFLNAVAKADPNGLYSPSMDSGSKAIIQRTGDPDSYVYTVVAGRDDTPVRHVSFLDAARFANWLHNDQPTGPQDATTTEDGAYPTASFIRRPGAKVFIPTEDEWYKAAFYDPDTESYFTTALAFTGNPICDVPSSTPRTANCGSAVGDAADVGGYTGSASPYGTLDQGGNISEWTETQPAGIQRVQRGGHYADLAFRLFSSYRLVPSQGTEAVTLGFRVAGRAAPGTTAQEFFTIDPAQSFVEIAGTSVLTVEFLGVVMAVDLPLESQVGAGGTAGQSDGLSTQLAGHLLVDIPEGGGADTLEIINRRSSVVLVDSGSWLPGLPESPEVSADGGLAANVETIPFALSMSAAIRGAEFSLGHSGVPELLTDLGDGLFSFSLGYMTNSLIAAPVNGVIDGEDSGSGLGITGRAALLLSEADLPTVVVGEGMLLEQMSGGRQLTLPFEIDLVLTDDTFAAGLPLSLRLDLTGQIVATNALFVPEPSSMLSALAVLVALAALHRTRRS